MQQSGSYHRSRRALVRLLAVLAVAAGLGLAGPAAADDKETVIGKVVGKDIDMGFFFVEVPKDMHIGKSAAHVKGKGGKNQKIKLVGYRLGKKYVFAARPVDQDLHDLRVGQKVYQFR